MLKKGCPQLKILLFLFNLKSWLLNITSPGALYQGFKLQWWSNIQFYQDRCSCNCNHPKYLKPWTLKLKLQQRTIF